MAAIPKASYQSAKGPPHLSIDKYISNTHRQYSELLEANPTEPQVQDFLVRHPALVPGHSTPTGRSGHYPLHCSLIVQPTLPGLPSYTPDFMWIATHSSAWFPTAIEIEKPSKKIFRSDGYPTADFSHARHQLAQWRSWFREPGNLVAFMEHYGIPSDMRDRSIIPHTILIYGRRSEFAGNPKLTKERQALLPGQDEELMSFDRLGILADMVDAISVKATGYGKYVALRVPPVFETGPDLADRFQYIFGLKQAIDRNEEITSARKEFLKGRIDYWKGIVPIRGMRTLPGERE